MYVAPEVASFLKLGEISLPRIELIFFPLLDLVDPHFRCSRTTTHIYAMDNKKIIHLKICFVWLYTYEEF